MTKARLQLLAVIVVLALLSVALFLKPANSWLDQSHESFLPKPLAAKLSTYRNFPIFWWNFLILESKPGAEIDPAKIGSLCRELAAQNKDRIAFLPCSADLVQLKPYLQDWVRDWPLRDPSPSKASMEKTVADATAKLSLPMDRDLLELLRLDPAQTNRALQALEGQSVKFEFEKYSGFYYDKTSGRTLLPVQFSFPPNEADKTNAVLESGRALDTSMVGIGPHLASFENEHQVKADVEAVSIAGTIFLIAISVFMIFTKQWRLLLFYPFLALSTLASITLTVWWFGKIHGLVLAFGPGIIGLSMDYAVHASFSASEKDETWLANAVGLLTTITVVLVGYFSKLPIIQQLMFFSGAGLFIGFIVFYLLNRSEPALFQAQRFFKKPLKSKALASLVLITAVFTVVGFVFAKPSLKLSDIGFESPKVKAATRWLVMEGKMRAPFVTISSGQDALRESEADLTWAKANGLDLKTVTDLVPPVVNQKSNLSSWQSGFCNYEASVFKNSKELFSPFLGAIDCGSKTVLDLTEQPPRYVRDFHSFEGDEWISLWFPKEDSDVSKLKAHKPEASSLVELATLFPEALSKEVFWMAPAIFLLSTLLLIIYYKRPLKVGLALLPFLTGLGTYFVAFFVFGLTMSFVSFISFIMIFGFSLDYGIFAANVGDADSAHGDEVRSALTLTTSMTLAGFVPLLFAKHPAMRHLGEGLVAGTIGTYLGAVSAVPYLSERLEKARRSRA